VTGDPTQNPYFKAETKPHYLDRDSCRVRCFDVFNIMSASVALAGDYEIAEEDEPAAPSSMFKLHHRLAEPRLSQLLLEIAVFVRTFDDLMSSLAPEAYAKFAAETDGDNFIGTLDGAEEFRLRDACNKIIHATDFRPVYEHADREIQGGESQRVWHLDGQIELEGTLGKKVWQAVIFVEQFLEIVLDRLEFDAPERESHAANANGSR
jgi:hypothetical protein